MGLVLEPFSRYSGFLDKIPLVVGEGVVVLVLHNYTVLTQSLQYPNTDLITYQVSGKRVLNILFIFICTYYFYKVELVDVDHLDLRIS